MKKTGKNNLNHSLRIIVAIALATLLPAAQLMAQEPIDSTLTAGNDSSFRRIITVIDIETNIPIKGVSVRPDRQQPLQTDFMGRVELTQRFDSVSFSHVQYTPERLSFIEANDTMFLFPRHNLLGEVVVMGVGPDLRKAMKTAHDNMMAQPVIKGLYFDFGLMLDKRARRDRKHLKKAKEMLREWDLKPTYEELKEREKRKDNQQQPTKEQ